jgi:hypothetical protein
MTVASRQTVLLRPVCVSCGLCEGSQAKTFAIVLLAFILRQQVQKIHIQGFCDGTQHS